MIIAIDFDGTLHAGKWPAIDAPVTDAIKVMQQLKADGHYLIIWTCREGEPQRQMIDWLVKNNIPFDCINDHQPGTTEFYGYASRKVYAHLYIDDKQIGGLPSWERIYKYVCKVEKAYKETKAKEYDVISLTEYCDFNGINPEELIGRKRNKDLNDKREVYWYLLNNAGMSYSEIGRMFNRTHATVLSGIKRIKQLIEIGDIIILKLSELQ